MLNDYMRKILTARVYDLAVQHLVPAVAAVIDGIDFIASMITPERPRRVLAVLAQGIKLDVKLIELALIIVVIA